METGCPGRCSTSAGVLGTFLPRVMLIRGHAMSDSLLHRFTCVISKSFFARGIVRERRTPPAWQGLEPLEQRLLLSPLYWDPDGIASCNNIQYGTGLGGSGYWTTAPDMKVWYDPSTCTDIAWPTSCSYEAVFWGSSGTVHLSANITAQSLTFKTGGYTVENAYTLTLATGEVEVTSCSATVGSVIAGSSGLTKKGSGTLTLSGVNTYTGTTTIKGGTLMLDGGDNRLPTGTTVTLGDYSSCSTGILKLNGRSQEVAGLSRANAYSGNEVVNGGCGVATLMVNTACSDSTFAGVLADGSCYGSLSLTKKGSCTLTLSGASTYTGTTTIQGGTLKLDGGDNRLPIGTKVMLGDSSSGTGILKLNGWNQEVAGLSTTCNSCSVNNQVINGGSSAATLTVNTGSCDSCFAGVLADGWAGGNLSLIKKGSCTLTLWGVSTYTGATTIQGGTLALGGGDNRLPTGTTVTLEGPSFGPTAYLKLGGYSQAVGGLTASGSPSYTAVINGTSYTATLTVSIAAGISTYYGLLGGSGNDGNLGLTKAGAGTLVLAGSNSYTGATTISGGVLRAGLGTGLPNASNLVFAGGVLEASGTFGRYLGTGADQVQWTGDGGFSAFGDQLTVAIGGTCNPTELTWGGTYFVPNGNQLMFGSAASDSPVEFVNDIDMGSAVRTVDVKDNSSWSSDSAELSGDLSWTEGLWFTKSGDGTLILSGTVTEGSPPYDAGAVTIGDGTLQLDTYIASFQPVYVDSGARLTGSGFAYGSFNPCEYTYPILLQPIGVNLCCSEDYVSDDLNCFGVTRQWTTAGQYNPDIGMGPGWAIAQWPRIMEAGDDQFVVVNSASGRRVWFYEMNALHGALDTLTSCGGVEFVLTDALGNVTKFYGFGCSVPAIQRGAFKSFTDPMGNSAAASCHDEDGNLTQLLCTHVADDAQELYVCGYENGRLTSVLLSRSPDGGTCWTDLRQVTYAYYVDEEDYGNEGDLKTAVIGEYEGQTLKTVETKYYRYYTPEDSVVGGEVRGYPHALKFAFEGDAYARLAASCDPESDDPTVLSFATLYCEYDIEHRLAQAVRAAEGCSVCGGTGQGTCTYSCTWRDSPAIYNSWRYKIVEYLPGYASPPTSSTSVRTTYYNYAGQVMLEVFSHPQSSQEWRTFHKYDDDGREILTADPVAVTGYDDTYADLLHEVSGNYVYLADGAGLITLTDYSTSTTATTETAGEVAGNLHTTSIKPGETGTAVLQQHVDYIASPTVGDTTIYPVNSVSVYSGTGGTGERKTSYSYTWFTGSFWIESRETTYPVVSTGHNGSCEANLATTFFDQFGRPIWMKDGDHFLFYTEYDPATGAVTKTIADVDTTKTDDFENKPSGWATLGAGLHLVTTYEVDDQGRTTKVTDPNGNITYTVYSDAVSDPIQIGDSTATILQEVRTYPGWTAENTTTGPILIHREVVFDYAESSDRSYFTENLTVAVAPTVQDDQPTGSETFDADDIRSLSRSYVNVSGQVVTSDSYYSLDDVTYSLEPDIGSASANYLRTTYAYCVRGWVNRTVRPDGTIERIAYHPIGRVVSQWVGTDDTPDTGEWSPTNNAGANMVETVHYYYDQATPGSEDSGVGDGNVTETQTLYGGGTGEYYKTVYKCDWRNRLTDTRGPDNVATKTAYDNLDEATLIETYADADTDFEIDSGELRGKVERAYDERGRLYRTYRYEVDPETGDDGDRLVSDIWYNARGMVMKTADANGLFSKAAYDGAGRAVASYVSYDTDESGYSEAQDVSGDTVIEQTNTIYDAGSRPVANLFFQRWHNADAESTGELTAVNSHATASVTWYDKVGRVTHSINFGHDRNSDRDEVEHYIFDFDYDEEEEELSYSLIDSDSDGIPDEADAWNDVTEEAHSPCEPNTSDDYIVTRYDYDEVDDGDRYDEVTDNRGIHSRTYYDLLGRVTRTVANYANGIDEVDIDTDQTTEYLYDSAGRLSVLRARNPLGENNGIQDQETRYLYESEIDRSWVTTVVYPDSSGDGALLTVSNLTRSGTTATVHTAAAHGYSDDNQVRISGANQAEYDGWFTIDVTGEDTFTYTVSPSAATPATGTIKVKRLGADVVRTTYDRLGRVTTVTDQRGVVHTYSYDAAGRLASDAATTVPSGVDSSVRCISYRYYGTEQTVTSLTRDGSTATVILANHGYTTGNLVQISGAEQAAYNGSFVITKVDDDTFTYTVSGSPTSPATWTIKAKRLDCATGRLEAVTSWENADGTGDILSQVKFHYDSWGNVSRAYQSHAGTVDDDGVGDDTPCVQYVFDDGAVGNEAKYVRLSSVTYPNDRVVYYNYPESGVGSALSRLDNIASSDTPDEDEMFAQYTYLGAGTIVQVAHPNVDGGLTLDYTGPGYGNYPGFDRLGRVAYQSWVTDGGTYVDRWFYGYDRDSNRLWRADRTDLYSTFAPSDRDEAYEYDGLNRLVKAQRGWIAYGTPIAPGPGDFNSDGLVNGADLDIVDDHYDGGPGTNAQWTDGDWNGDGRVDDNDVTFVNLLYNTNYSPRVASQTWQWGLDAQGNWTAYNEDAGPGGQGQWDLEQTREHNAANEIDTDADHGDADEAAIYEDSGQAQWVGPAYDAAGNLIEAPVPGSETARQKYVYDAWNHLVQVTDDEDVVIATYRYDGLGRRIQKLLGPDPEDPTATYDYFYNESWQAVEVRLDGVADPLDQFLWDVRYIDAPVVRFHDGNTDGDVDGGSQEGDNTLYYTTDANWNVTALVDAATGEVVERYMYDPYGKATVCEEDWTPREGNASAVANDVLYCGYRWDFETGLYQVRRRYYHAGLGRWGTRDPLGYLDSHNLYDYATGRAVSWLDPYGTEAFSASPPDTLTFRARLELLLNVKPLTTVDCFRHGSQKCFDWDWKLRGAATFGKPSISTTFDLYIGAQWSLRIDHLKNTTDCFCCPKTGKMGTALMRQWVTHPSQNDSWEKDMKYPAGQEPSAADQLDRTRRQYVFPDGKTDGHQQPNKQHFGGGTPQEAYSWDDWPGVGYSTATGGTVTMDWAFYVEIWRDCGDVTQNAKLDAATFYVQLHTVATKGVTDPKEGFLIKRGESPWGLRTATWVAPILWQS